MPCFSRLCAIPSKVSPSAAKFCARNSTPWLATPRARFSPGTAARTRHIPRKSSLAAPTLCNRPSKMPCGGAPPWWGRPCEQDPLDTHMPTRYWLRLAEPPLASLLTLALFFSWRADRRDRSQLASELASTKQLLAAADARQHDRDTQLAQILATLAAEKRAAVTPAQVIRELPSQISLPSPIALQSPPASQNSPSPQTNAVLPAEDLKPLYDFTIDCKACQAKLAAAQDDLTDERKKTTSLTHERDDALRIARGRTDCRRIGRAAKCVLIGAAAGAVPAKAAH